MRDAEFLDFYGQILSQLSGEGLETPGNIPPKQTRAHGAARGVGSRKPGVGTGTSSKGISGYLGILRGGDGHDEADDEPENH